MDENGGKLWAGLRRQRQGLKVYRAPQLPTGIFSLVSLSPTSHHTAFKLLFRDEEKPLFNTSQDEANRSGSLACSVAYLINNDYSFTHFFPSRGCWFCIEAFVSQFLDYFNNNFSFLSSPPATISFAVWRVMKQRDDLSRDNQILILNGQIYNVISSNLQTLIKKPSSRL